MNTVTILDTVAVLVVTPRLIAIPVLVTIHRVCRGVVPVTIAVLVHVTVVVAILVHIAVIITIPVHLLVTITTAAAALSLLRTNGYEHEYQYRRQDEADRYLVFHLLILL